MKNAWDKLAECQYFLARMRETANEPQIFPYNVSAYLNAFQGVEYLLRAGSKGVPGAKEWIDSTFDSRSADLLFLRAARHANVHEEPVAPEAQKETLRTPVPMGWKGSYYGAYSVTPPGAPSAVTITYTYTWYFDHTVTDRKGITHPKPTSDVISVCSDRLQELAAILSKAEEHFATLKPST